MLRNTTALFALTLAASLTASADFSYTSTMKATGGSMAAMAGTAADRTNKVYFKGQKMMTTSGDTSTIIDFGARTITTVNGAAKTYTVKTFSDLTGTTIPEDVSVDVKETGQKKTVNGFDASETIVTMNMDMDMGRGAPAMKLKMEMDMWISPDVPGAGEMRKFFETNAANFPWAAMAGGGGNQSMQKAMAQMEREMARMKGAVVEQVIRVKPAEGSAAPQVTMPTMPTLTPAQQAQMQAAMSKMTPQMQAQMQGMMGGMGRGAAPAAGGGSASLIEMTMDDGGFSSADVPDTTFAIPAGYAQK